MESPFHEDSTNQETSIELVSTQLAPLEEYDSETLQADFTSILTKQTAIKTEWKSFLATFSKLPTEEQEYLFHLSINRVREHLNPTKVLVELLQQISSVGFSLYCIQLITFEEDSFFTKDEWDSFLKELNFPDQKWQLNQLLEHKYVALDPSWTVEKSKKYIKKRLQMIQVASVDQIFVVDRSTWSLKGIVEWGHLLVSKPSALISDIQLFIPSCSTFDDKDNIIMAMKYYQITNMPIVSKTNSEMLSTVTLHYLQYEIEEVEPEILKKSPKEWVIFYLKQLLRKLFVLLKRTLWMAVLLLVNLISSVVIGEFEEKLEEIIALVFFIPIVAAIGGNSGEQSAHLFIQYLAKQEGNDPHGGHAPQHSAKSASPVKPKRLTVLQLFRKFFYKLFVEVFISFGIGFVMGVLILIVGFARSNYSIAILSGLSLATIVFVANMIGIIVPFGFKLLRMNPALASGAIICSLLDTIGLVIFFLYVLLIFDVFHLPQPENDFLPRCNTTSIAH